jgi:hypothetical protein
MLGAALALLALALLGVLCACSSLPRRPLVPPNSPAAQRLPLADPAKPIFQHLDGEFVQVHLGNPPPIDYVAENRQWLAVRGRWFLALGALLAAVGFGLALATTMPILDFAANILAYIGLALAGAGLAFLQAAQWWWWVSAGCGLAVVGLIGYRLLRHRNMVRWPVKWPKLPWRRAA